MFSVCWKAAKGDNSSSGSAKAGPHLKRGEREKDVNGRISVIALGTSPGYLTLL